MVSLIRNSSSIWRERSESKTKRQISAGTKFKSLNRRRVFAFYHALRGPIGFSRIRELAKCEQTNFQVAGLQYEILIVTNTKYAAMQHRGG